MDTATATQGWRVERTEPHVVQVTYEDRLVSEWRWNDWHGWHESTRIFTVPIPDDVWAKLAKLIDKEP